MQTLFQTIVCVRKRNGLFPGVSDALAAQIPPEIVAEHAPGIVAYHLDSGPDTVKFEQEGTCQFFGIGPRQGAFDRNLVVVVNVGSEIRPSE
jgi:hypothetical protein